MISVTLNQCCFFATLGTLLVFTSCESLTCFRGSDISFECPRCSTEPNNCIFKNLLRGGNIWVDNAVTDPRYKMWKDKTHITLTKCNPGDAGTYIWMCGSRSANWQFHLEVLEATGTTTTTTTRNKISKSSANPTILATALTLVLCLICSLFEEAFPIFHW